MNTYNKPNTSTLWWIDNLANEPDGELVNCGWYMHQANVIALYSGRRLVPHDDHYDRVTIDATITKEDVIAAITAFKDHNAKKWGEPYRKQDPIISYGGKSYGYRDATYLTVIDGELVEENSYYAEDPD